MINTFFSSCLNTSVAPLSPHSHLDFSIGDCPNELLCEVKSIVDLLLKIPSDTSSGPDGISARMLLATAHSISLPLVMIFNHSIKSGYFPDVWKTSHVIPIPKQNPACSSPSSYRPISLLPLVSKVFERHIFNWLLNFCQTNNLISPFQFGFRPSYSTESALIVSTTRWFKLLDQGYSVCSVFFNLKKSL